MFNLLKKMFGAGGGAEATAEASDPEEYEGFQIVACPRQVSGGWSTEGVISKHIDGELKESSFIRADTCMSREDAVQMIMRKGRVIIDEQGDKLFS